MYVRYSSSELLSSKRESLVCLNLKPKVLSLPGTFVVSTGKYFCGVKLAGYIYDIIAGTIPAV